jgi:AraC-like DNA-binding protein
MVNSACVHPQSGGSIAGHFSTDDLPPRDREEFFVECVAKYVMNMTCDRPDSAGYRAQFDARIAGRFTLFEYQTRYRTGLRKAADIGRVRGDTFRVQRLPGECISRSTTTPARAVEFRLAAGDFSVSSNEWPVHGPMEEGRAASGILIPHGVLSPLIAGGHLTGPVVIRAGSPLGSVLGAAVDAANTQVPLLSPELGKAVLQNLCGLVALACGASEEGRWSGRDSLRAARLEGAKRHIAQHLAEPGLTPASTAAALGISLRHLHLLFEPTGTSFAQYVARQRLRQCHAALTSGVGVQRSVADIAFGWGFNSLATFYRAFEREFDLPPFALRAAVAAG